MQERWIKWARHPGLKVENCVCASIAGFNVETVEYKNISFTVWDVGGQDKVSNACLLAL